MRPPRVRRGAGAVVSARHGAQADVFAEMGRWEVATGAELRPGDVVVLDPRAVDELLDLEARSVDWEALPGTARTVADRRTRRGTTTLTLENTVGRLLLPGDELVLRLLTQP